MKINREGKSAINRITKATGADKGILKNISDTIANGKAQELSIDVLEDFPGHKFKIYSEKELDSLAQNIKMIGLIDPITVWNDKKGHYYILCGHNRVRACKLIGMTTVSCIVKNYDNIEIAKLAVNASNIDRRGGFECLSFEEKCSVIVEDFDTLKELYKKDKEKYGLGEVVGFDAKKEVSVHYQLSASQASVYYRLGKTFRKDWLALIPKHMNVKAAYQLSQLKKENLKDIIEDIINAKDNDDTVIKISETQAKIIKQMENENMSSKDMILTLYSTTKKKEKKTYSINFENEAFAPYFKKIQSVDDNTLQSIFLDALQKYFEK